MNTEPHTNQLIYVLMRTGKSAGRVVTVLDAPFAVERTGSRVEIMLPGVEGVGTIVDRPEDN